MVIKGLKHVAEISRMFDSTTHRERFRYSLRRETSPDILYWGHEHTEEAALEMANMYLNLQARSTGSAHSILSKLEGRQSLRNRPIEWERSPATGLNLE